MSCDQLFFLESLFGTSLSWMIHIFLCDFPFSLILYSFFGLAMEIKKLEVEHGIWISLYLIGGPH